IETRHVPDTLQGLLLARVDRLPEDAKWVIRVACVIGRQFHVGLLREACEAIRANVSVLPNLELLVDEGLIRGPDHSESGVEYLFRHALIQDAAYASLLRQDRRRLHRVVGEAPERIEPDRLGDMAPLLG